MKTYNQGYALKMFQCSWGLWSMSIIFSDDFIYGKKCITNMFSAAPKQDFYSGGCLEENTEKIFQVGLNQQKFHHA